MKQWFFSTINHGPAKSAGGILSRIRMPKQLAECWHKRQKFQSRGAELNRVEEWWNWPDPTINTNESYQCQIKT